MHCQMLKMFINLLCLRQNGVGMDRQTEKDRLEAESQTGCLYKHFSHKGIFESLGHEKLSEPQRWKMQII